MVEIPGYGARLLVKVEAFNPGGSVKDRTALSMIRDAEARGILTPGATIIEPTSGNTGVGLAMVSAVLGYRTIFTMPETMSVERRSLLQAYGAEIVLTPGAEGMAGSVREAERLRDTIAGAVILGQFVNPANPLVHEQTTGPEIWADTEGSVDAFVAGVGTGGTLIGTARFLKAHKPEVQIVAVEPASSPLLSGGVAGPHAIQGIGANFVPEIYDAAFVDRIITIENDEALSAARTLARKHGILVGISSGAAFAAACRMASEDAWRGKTIVTILPDTGERYLSVWNKN